MSETTLPPQHQDRQPGREHEMDPAPESWGKNYVGSGRLAGKGALITGGDSGIGRAVAIAFAKEGADVAITYLEEERDAAATRAAIEREGRRCEAIRCDIGDEDACRDLVERTVQSLGRLDVLVNNAAEQHPRKSIAEISTEQLQRTFATNVFSMFYLVKATLTLPLGRPGQPDEVAHGFVFLASEASSYMSGQVLHPNGGEVING